MYEEQPPVSHIEENVMNLVNEYRVSLGLNILEFDSIAYDFASEHTTYMVTEGRPSHDNFEFRSSNLSIKVNANYVSENVGRNFTTAESIVKAWIKSPTHKKVMEGNFTNTAVSINTDDQGVQYITQLFYK